jgi:hypothetical protein
MGTTGAQGFAELVEEGSVSLESAISWHMQSNHYPPHPRFMIPVAIRAIELANDGLWDEAVDLPEQVQWAEDWRLPTAAEIVESFHLDAFIDEEE